METKTIVFKFDGPDVNIKTFGKDFLSLANHVYNLAQSCTDEEPRFESFENNCITIKMIVPVIASLALCGGDVSAIRDVGKYNASIRGLNGCLRTHNATMEFSDPGRNSVCRFDVDNEIPQVEDSHTEVKSTIAIYGELVDVGGTNPNAHIRSDAFPSDVVLEVDRVVAKQLAVRLYDPIGVNATVTIRDGKVVAGKVLEVINYEPEDLESWLSKNGKMLGVEAFEGVDLSAFIAGQRI